MTRVIVLMSWYEENPAWLAASVASCKDFAAHIVAVDGAYALYPQGRARSGSEQAEAVRETCRGLGIGCTIHEPDHPWVGSEVEKRSFMFALGELVAQPGDWFMILDADEVVTSTPTGFIDQLAATELDCGDVTFWERRIQLESDAPGAQFIAPPVSEQHIRILFRAGLGLTVRGKHYYYVTADGRNLWGDLPLEDAADFTLLRVEHRSKFRDPGRRHDAKAYYDLRDELRIEG